MENVQNKITLEQRAARIAQDEQRHALSEIIKAAEIKFSGNVEKVEMMDAGEYSLIIKRTVHIFGSDRCFMRIRASMSQDTGKPMFYWGHYDLTEHGAYRQDKQ